MIKVFVSMHIIDRIIGGSRIFMSMNQLNARIGK